MSKTISLVQRVIIASPCPAEWDEMTGDDRVRFCSQCSLNVYNLSAMTEREAEAVLTDSEGRLCARIYRRADGTILTRDCPVGLAAVRRRVRLAFVRAAASILFVGLMATWVMAGHRRAESNFPWLANKPAYRQAVDTVHRWTTRVSPAPRGGWVGGVVALPNRPASGGQCEVAIDEDE